MAGDLTAGYIVSDVERLREPMSRIYNFIEDKVGPGVLLPVSTKSNVINVELLQKANC